MLQKQLGKSKLVLICLRRKNLLFRPVLEVAASYKVLIISPVLFRESLSNSLEVTLKENRATCEEAELIYSIRFSPNRVVHTEVELVVQKTSGGRWSFILDVSATAPDPDGVIVIEAQMNNTTSVPVMLYSPSESPEQFTATFTPDTPLQFDVIPQQVFALEPYG